MRLIGLIRLGRDAELRYTQDGTPVANIAGAWNYGRKGQDGNRPTQWADFTLWGERAEKLVDYLLKGREFEVFATDVHVEEFQRRDGTNGAKLVGRIAEIEFTAGSRQPNDAGSGGNAGGAHGGPGATTSNTPRSGLTGNAGSNAGAATGQQPFVPDQDFDDDIPF